MYKGVIKMQHYKDLNDLLEKCPNAYKYYSSLSYDIQEMLNDAMPNICNENDLINYVDNYIGIDYN